MGEIGRKMAGSESWDTRREFITINFIESILIKLTISFIVLLN